MSEIDLGLMERIAEFCEAWPEACFLGHVVLEDLNLDDYSIHSAIRDFQQDRTLDQDERAAGIRFLTSLLDIDESIRCP